ncbi:MAG TPA: hypothetical protein VGC13_06595 [Longimicrobium sp.]|jgi:hypothetical protein|uniref:hypothetical protein n=1 Tax=Longimicrobium sp. TaxID=2029185 RepID=UPI002EDB7636
MSERSFKQAQQRYARIRQHAYALARDDAFATGRVDAPLRLADCDPYTLSVWKTTWAGPHPSGWGGWDWEPLLRRAWKHPSAFHLAIWSDRILCGLAVGRVSDRDPAGLRHAVSIDFIESAHDPHHPLHGNIAVLATSAADAYGHALGARWLRLIQPLPGVVTLYTNLGFDVVREGDRVLYCERRIEP